MNWAKYFKEIRMPQFFISQDMDKKMGKLKQMKKVIMVNNILSLKKYTNYGCKEIRDKN